MNLLDSLFAKANKSRKDRAAAEEELAAKHVEKKLRKCEKRINSLADEGKMSHSFREGYNALDNRDVYWAAFHKILAEKLGLKYVPNGNFPSVSWDKQES